MDRLLLEVKHGAPAGGHGGGAGTRRVLSPGESLRVGRTELADLVIPDDQMSGAHFSVKWNGRTAFVEDLGSVGGTALAGGRIGTGKVVAPHAAWLRAGATDFMLFHEAETLRTKPELLELSPVASDAYHQICAEPYPIHGVLDCARDARILPLLRESVDTRRCLLEGVKGRASEEQAPHLVAFEDDSELLRVLVGIGFGQRFGIFFSSPKPFEELRRHFRRLLMVTDEETGERMFFRFYDPVVLRTFMPAATRAHRELMFGPVFSYLIEAPDRSVRRLSREELGVPSLT